MIIGQQARQAILRGVESLYNAVSVTLGPKGKNVILHNEEGIPYVTKDGVSVAKHVHSSNVYENAGIHLVREAALKTAELAGDGTTTSTILAYNLVTNGMRLIENYAQADVRSGMLKAKEQINTLLKSHIKDVPLAKEPLSLIATTSANNDTEIGDVVAEAFMNAKREGVVLIKESASPHTYIEKKDGTTFNRGLVDNAFINRPEKMSAVYRNVKVVLIDDRVDKFSVLQDILQQYVQVLEDAVVIIAHDFSPEVIRLMALNHCRGTINILPIRAEGIGSNKSEFIKDIAALVGSTQDKEGSNIYKGGSCLEITSNQVSTVITVENSNNEAFIERLSRIKALINEESDPQLKKYYEERLATLAGTLVTIHVGGYTPVERKEKYDRVEDAVCAVKAALEEGVVVGGGITYWKLSKDLDPSLFTLSPGGKAGFKLVQDALLSPINTLCRNSEIDYSTIKGSLGNKVVDFKEGRVIDLKDSNIIDPAKVVRTAIEHSISVATMILSTECIIENIEE